MKTIYGQQNAALARVVYVGCGRSIGELVVLRMVWRHTAHDVIVAMGRYPLAVFLPNPTTLASRVSFQWLLVGQVYRVPAVEEGLDTVADDGDLLGDFPASSEGGSGKEFVAPSTPKHEDGGNVGGHDGDEGLAVGPEADSEDTVGCLVS